VARGAAEVAKLEAERQSAVALGDAQVKEIEATGEAKRQEAAATGHAKAMAIKTAGYAGAAVLVAVALAVVILAGGWSAATTRKAWAEAQLLTIGVEQSTLLPPPFVVTADGYLVDTRSGERARLRDAAGVNRLRLQTSADVTKAALGARAAAEIARATGRPEDGAGLLLPPQKGGNHGTV